MRAFYLKYYRIQLLNMVKIIQKENLLLREKAREVPPGEIKTAKIRNILADMKTALDAEEDGIAIAAPQIGVSLRIFLVSRKIHHISEDGEAVAKEIAHDTHRGKKDMVFINPEITKLSKKKVRTPEGCLSVRWLYGNVLRSDKATVRAYDENGKLFTRGASGLLAQVFQHETDHLNGVLFIDTAKNVEEIKPEEIRKRDVRK